MSDGMTALMYVDLFLFLFPVPMKHKSTLPQTNVDQVDCWTRGDHPELSRNPSLQRDTRHVLGTVLMRPLTLELKFIEILL